MYIGENKTFLMNNTDSFYFSHKVVQLHKEPGTRLEGKRLGHKVIINVITQGNKV